MKNARIHNPKSPSISPMFADVKRSICIARMGLVKRGTDTDATLESPTERSQYNLDLQIVQTTAVVAALLFTRWECGQRFQNLHPISN